MSNHDPLRDALRHRADQLGDTHPLTLDDVKGRARGIRRRRAAVSGLAAAAVLAVAVPIGIAATDRTGTDPDVPPVAGPSVTPSQDAPAPEGPQSLDLTVNVEAGDAEVAIPYLYDGAIHLPDGGQVGVDGQYQNFAPVGDGWAATRRDDEGNAFVDLLDAEGNVLVSAPSTGSLAVSEDRTVVAYATPEGELMTVTPDAERLSLVDPEALPEGILEPVSVIGSDSCDQDDAGGGCTVHFNSSDAEGQGAWSATSKGIVSPFPDLLWHTGLSPVGSLGGVTSVAEDNSTCSVILFPEWDKQAWKTCDHTLGRFSPDGRYVIGHPVYGDGIGDASVAILDARTGELLVEAGNSTEHQSFINNVVWDTDNTLVMTVFEKDTWSLLRMTPEGELSTVIPELGDNPDEVPLQLATQP